MTEPPTYRFRGGEQTVRSLTPRHPPRPHDGRGAPRGASPEAQAQRDDLEAHLASAYSVDDASLSQEVARLSVVERTWLEIEMADRSKLTGHVSDYDPLR